MKYLISIFTILALGLIIISFQTGPKIIYPTLENIGSIEDVFIPYVESPNTAGLSIATYNQGKIEYYHLGETLKETGIKPDGSTIYEIGSISKTFTAALLSDLSQENLIDLDDHICTYLPVDICPWKEEVDAITLQDLSKHQSGFPRLPNNFFPSYLRDIDNPYAHYTVDSLYKGVKTLPKKLLQKREHEYSNYAVGLLGQLLANSQNDSYAQLIDSRIFQKLKMTSSYIDVPEDKQEKFALGYNDKGKQVSHWDFPALAGAGAIKSTINDMMKYLEAHLNSEKPYVHTFTSPTVVSEGEKIGLGWYLQEKGENNIIWHNGGTGGFSSMMVMNMEKQKGIIALSNSAISVDQPAVLAMKYLLNQ